MVRHEAAEALGAIGDESAIDLLQIYAKDTRPEIAETCQVLSTSWLSMGKTNNVYIFH